VVTLPKPGGEEWTINDPVWGIELLREGNEGLEHESRFIPPYGSYCDFPIQEGCKGIIDFYSSPGATGRVIRRSSTHYVFLSNDRSTAQYFKPAATTCEIIKFKAESMARLPPNVLQHEVVMMDLERGV
jgi:hypothetical protein